MSLKTKEVVCDKDGYPIFEQAEWFMDLIEKMVSNPEEANFGRVKGGKNLELAIMVAPEDEYIFTDKVCLALEHLVDKLTGLSPIIYLQNKPSQRAINIWMEDRHYWQYSNKNIKKDAICCVLLFCKRGSNIIHYPAHA